MIENNSGQGKSTRVPDEIKKGWNWGGFFLTFIWGFYHRTYITFFCIIPFVTPIMAFIIGAKGNEWAWRNRAWPTVEQYWKSRRRWAWAGFGIFILMVILVLLSFTIEELPNRQARQDLEYMKSIFLQTDKR